MVLKDVNSLIGLLAEEVTEIFHDYNQWSPSKHHHSLCFVRRSFKKLYEEKRRARGEGNSRQCPVPNISPPLWWFISSLFLLHCHLPLLLNLNLYWFSQQGCPLLCNHDWHTTGERSHSFWIPPLFLSQISFSILLGFLCWLQFWRLHQAQQLGIGMVVIISMFQYMFALLSHQTVSFVVIVTNRLLLPLILSFLWICDFLPIVGWPLKSHFLNQIQQLMI